MEPIGLESKTNFFEQRVSDYNRPEQVNIDGGIKDTDILDDF